MSKFNYLTVDSCFWQQIIDTETNHKRNFKPFDTELLYVAKQFLAAYKERKVGVK